MTLKLRKLSVYWIATLIFLNRIYINCRRYFSLFLLSCSKSKIPESRKPLNYTQLMRPRVTRRLQTIAIVCCDIKIDVHVRIVTKKGIDKLYLRRELMQTLHRKVNSIEHSVGIMNKTLQQKVLITCAWT